jgi:hypothetical protein
MKKTQYLKQLLFLGFVVGIICCMNVEARTVQNEGPKLVCGYVCGYISSVSEFDNGAYISVGGVTLTVYGDQNTIAYLNWIMDNGFYCMVYYNNQVVTQIDIFPIFGPIQAVA